MAGGTLKFMMKAGLISEEMATPRTLTGAGRLFLYVVGVGFSYFFIHISFFWTARCRNFQGNVHDGRDGFIRPSFYGSIKADPREFYLARRNVRTF